jgi:hypothetical protein
MLPDYSSADPLMVLGISLQELPDISREALTCLKRHQPVLAEVFRREANVDHHGFTHRLDTGYLPDSLLLARNFRFSFLPTYTPC